MMLFPDTRSGRAFRHVLLAAALASGSMLALSPAQAQATVYTDRSVFLANTTVTTTLGFEGIAPDNSDNFYSTPPGLTLDGVNFDINPAVSEGNLFVIGKDSYYPGNSVLASQNSKTSTDDLLITFSAPVTAVGLDFGDNFSAQAFSFTLSDGESFSQMAQTGTNLGFFGVTSAVPITTLDIQAPTPAAGSFSSINIDNVTFGTAAPVPEASTTVSFGLLLALGMGGVVVAARKKKAAAAA